MLRLLLISVIMTLTGILGIFFQKYQRQRREKKLFSNPAENPLFMASKSASLTKSFSKTVADVAIIDPEEIDDDLRGIDFDDGLATLEKSPRKAAKSSATTEKIYVNRQQDDLNLSPSLSMRLKELANNTPPDHDLQDDLTVTVTADTLQSITIVSEDEQISASALPENDPIMVLNVIADPGESFMGYDLLQCLLQANLRYGAMRIFHRHEFGKGQGKVLFSVASATEPGTFDLSRIGSITCKGLSLFFNWQQTDNPQVVFELMLATARQLADQLGGAKVFNQQRQRIDHYWLEEIKQQFIQYREQQQQTVVLVTESC